jgi:cytochrome P450
MAILEGKLVASAILQQFRIVVQPGFVPQEKVSVTFAMRHGMPVTVQLRQ